MREPVQPKLSIWPFLVGDAAMLGAAWFIESQSKRPMGPWELFFVLVCVAGGACLAIMPFLLEYRLAAKLAEASNLADAVGQLQKLEKVASQVTGATGHWETTQQQAEKTATLSRALAERMTNELKAFSQFMERANDSERGNLRLEIDKLRRAENEWLQVLVRMLDHVHALHLGAMRSGQPRLIEQLTQFQTACHDAARRVGLAPFAPSESEPFDSQRHQLIDGEPKPVANSLVAEAVACGYTYQGKLLRPALVRLRNGVAAVAASPASGQDENDESGEQSQLAFR